MILYESLDTPRKAKFDPGIGYRWVMSLRFEGMKHLKTDCFKHS